MYMVALEWGVDLDRWDGLAPDVQARMIATSRAKSQMDGIRAHIINKPKRTPKR